MTCIEDKLPTSFSTHLDAIYMKVNRGKSVPLSIEVMCMYKSFVVMIQVLPKREDIGSVVHWTLEYDKLHDEIAHLETLLQFIQDISKDINVRLSQ
ncbi:hypothetical protein Golob_026763, partial [Gossypium lobatum]|nr:hypothetical protein [Gossypium lobatum]